MFEKQPLASGFVAPSKQMGSAKMYNATKNGKSVGQISFGVLVLACNVYTGSLCSH